jgi:hypothetical protein
VRIAAAALAAVSAVAVSVGAYLLLPAAGVIVAGLFGLGAAWLLSYVAVSR